MPVTALGACPKCKLGRVVPGNFAWNCNRWKEGCDFKIRPIYAKKSLSESHVKQLLKKGQTRTIKDFQGKHGFFDATLRLNEEYKVELVFEERSTVIGPCPQCEEGHVVKQVRSYNCDRYNEGCEFKVWKTIAKKHLKDTHIKALLKQGKTPLIKGFRGKYGKFDAVLRIGDQGEVVLDSSSK